MEQYIKKFALVAEMENLLDKCKHHDAYQCAYRDGNNGALYALKNKLNTLEVKEVDFDKELSEVWRDWANEYAISFVSYKEIAKHFFEYGLKAQKGEWSNFDTYMMIGLISFLERHKTVETEVSDPSLQDVINWLKTKYGKSN